MPTPTLLGVHRPKSVNTNTTTNTTTNTNISTIKGMDMHIRMNTMYSSARTWTTQSHSC